MSETRTVPGMAWLPGTGPAGTFCAQCLHAGRYDTQRAMDLGLLFCGRSKPVNGRHVQFKGWSESCRHFEERPPR